MKLMRLALMGVVLAVVGVAGDRFEWSEKMEATASTVAGFVEVYRSASDKET